MLGTALAHPTSQNTNGSLVVHSDAAHSARCCLTPSLDRNFVPAAVKLGLIVLRLTAMLTLVILAPAPALVILAPALAEQDKLDAQRVLFEGASRSCAARANSPPKTRKNNKGTAVRPDSPDCGLSPNNPGRDGTRSSRRLFAYSPEPKVEKVD